MLEGPAGVKHRGELGQGPGGRLEPGSYQVRGQMPSPRAGAGGGHGASGRVVGTEHPQSRVKGALEEYCWVREDEGWGGLGTCRGARW